MGWQRARERSRAATQRTSASAQVARLSSTGPQWSAIDGRPLRARTSLSLRGRLWQLDYVHGTGAARLGGGRAVAGRCGGAVGGVVGAPTMHVCEAWLCALSVLYVCLYVPKLASHLIFARRKVCTFDIYSIPTLITYARPRPTD